MTNEYKSVLRINKYLFNHRFLPEYNKFILKGNEVFMIWKEHFKFPFYNTEYEYTDSMFFSDARKYRHCNPMRIGLYNDLEEAIRAFIIEKQRLIPITFYNTHNGCLVTGEYIYIEFYQYYDAADIDDDLSSVLSYDRSSDGILMYALSAV